MGFLTIGFLTIVCHRFTTVICASRKSLRLLKDSPVHCLVTLGSCKWLVDYQYHSLSSIVSSIIIIHSIIYQSREPLSNTIDHSHGAEACTRKKDCSESLHRGICVGILQRQRSAVDAMPKLTDLRPLQQLLREADMGQRFSAVESCEFTLYPWLSLTCLVSYKMLGYSML